MDMRISLLIMTQRKGTKKPPITKCNGGVSISVR